ncbi:MULTISPECIES: FAD:protein FMN transferase [Snodgrassella]|uniref:FAD:protein FMN transferase n=1 Tax=Snodgrassella TaxID=1193515 RepID=UPI000995F67A|nr:MULTISPECIES: FAD:protein FMN transferase [Snodgrassella]MBI0129655.1 FAD:protein FMN transferase [Snodgrassella sp. W8124]NUE80430.1 FAD:protein FMN transferase [Snodgrassella sp. ESL0304]OOX78524.1 thiamine biosynthesis protein ApbE [Snodgrassella alvi]ORF00748.1 thiamine biosynthesis protein ApbE [Snodgrassella alvi]ORF27870.1 thiamine biosynthesis protein ApbE [Snodgrassella alvi]
MSGTSYTYSQQLMGTTVSLKLFVENLTAVSAVFNAIEQLEAQLTVNRYHSEVMGINHAAGKQPVAVSKLVFDLISQAKAASLLPDSKFNLAIGPLVKLWKIGFNGRSIPEKDEIARRLTLTNPNHIDLNRTNQTVYLAKAGMEIDLGAIAKGYIADIIKLLLAQYNIFQAIINCGGNVLTIGYSPITADKQWHIGLKRPFAEANNLLGIIHVEDKSVVTSGIYERYFIFNDQLYHHILDPHTGYPLNNELHSVTIISDNSLTGDIYSTIFYGLGIRQGLSELKKKQNIGVIFVTRDKKIIIQSNQHFTFELTADDYQLISYS